MIQILVFLAIVGIGVLLYKSLVVKWQPKSNPELSTAEPSVAEPAPSEPESLASPSPVSTTAQVNTGEAAVTNDVGPQAAAEAQAAQAKAAEKVDLEVPSAPPVPADLMAQVGGLEETQDPLARHRLYQQIIDVSYRNRNADDYRAVLHHYAREHIDEFATIAPLLKQQNAGKLPQVATFKHYASALSEVELYDEAIAVCQQALEYQLKDGTKSGYQGRIERIHKLQTRGLPA